jgi:hypothetical protein
LKNRDKNSASRLRIENAYCCAAHKSERIFGAKRQNKPRTFAFQLVGCRQGAVALPCKHDYPAIFGGRNIVYEVTSYIHGGENLAIIHDRRSESHAKCTEFPGGSMSLVLKLRRYLTSVPLPSLSGQQYDRNIDFHFCPSICHDESVYAKPITIIVVLPKLAVFYQNRYC